MKIFELVKEIENTLNCENADFEARQIVLHSLGADNTEFMKIRRDEAEESIVETAEYLFITYWEDASFTVIRFM